MVLHGPGADLCAGGTSLLLDRLGDLQADPVLDHRDAVKRGDVEANPDRVAGSGRKILTHELRISPTHELRRSPNTAQFFAELALIFAAAPQAESFPGHVPASRKRHGTYL